MRRACAPVNWPAEIGGIGARTRRTGVVAIGGSKAGEPPSVTPVRLAGTVGPKSWCAVCIRDTKRRARRRIDRRSCAPARAGCSALSFVLSSLWNNMQMHINKNCFPSRPRGAVCFPSAARRLPRDRGWNSYLFYVDQNTSGAWLFLYFLLSLVLEALWALVRPWNWRCELWFVHKIGSIL